LILEISSQSGASDLSPPANPAMQNEGFKLTQYSGHKFQKNYNELKKNIDCSNLTEPNQRIERINLGKNTKNLEN